LLRSVQLGKLNVRLSQLSIDKLLINNKLKNKILLFFLFIFAFKYSNAQEGLTVRGIVKDFQNGETMPYVNIAIASTGIGTSTNLDGYFTIFNVPSDTATLLVSHLGFSIQKFKLSPEIIGKQVVIEIVPYAVKLKTIEITAKKDQIMEVADEISKISINPAQLVNMPNLGEVDIFRSLQLLPGISGANESSSGLYVRGGTPDQNLVLLDGITVYHVDHFFGIFSAFNASAIKDLQIFKGGFESKYGGRISSVVDMTAKSGNIKKASVGIGVNLLSSNMVVEIPFWDKKVSLLLAGRRSYTDFLQSPTYNKLFDNITEEEESKLGFGIGGLSSENPEFHFFDMNAKLTYRPSGKDIIAVNLYNSKDNLNSSSTFDLGGLLGSGGNSNSRIETSDITNWGNRGLSGKWSRQWNNRFYTNLIGAYSNYFSDYEFITGFYFDTLNIEFTTIQDNNVQDVTVRLDNEFQINNKNKLEFGSWITNYHIQYINTLDDTVTLQDRDDKGGSYAFYVQNTFKPFKALSFKPGMRITYFDVTAKTYLEPRVSFGYRLSKKINLKGAWGRYYQFVNRVILENIFGGSRDFWLIADGENLPVLSSYHYIFGAAYETKNLLFDIEAYRKDIDGLLEYSLRYGTLLENAATPDELYLTGTGIIYGIDFLIQKKFGKYTGWIAYTLNDVKHTFPDIDKGKPFPALHDQRHEVKVINTLDMGKFNISGTFVYATGKPYTAPIGQYSITLLDGKETKFIYVGDKNSSRLPAYHRMDIAFTYNFKFKNISGNAGISFFNVYNRKNIKYKRFQLLEFDPDTFIPIEPKLITTDVMLLGFVPSMFLNLNF